MHVTMNRISLGQTAILLKQILQKLSWSLLRPCGTFFDSLNQMSFRNYCIFQWLMAAFVGSATGFFPFPDFAHFKQLFPHFLTLNYVLDCTRERCLRSMLSQFWGIFLYLNLDLWKNYLYRSYHEEITACTFKTLEAYFGSMVLSSRHRGRIPSPTFSGVSGQAAQPVPLA